MALQWRGSDKWSHYSLSAAARRCETRGSGKRQGSVEVAALQQLNLSGAFLLYASALSSQSSLRGTETSESKINFIISLGEKKNNLKK